MQNILLSWFYWDPEQVLFYIPYINHPVAWYGLFFAFAFIAGHFLIIHILSHDLSKTFRYEEGHILNWSKFIEQFKSGIKNDTPEMVALFNNLETRYQQKLLQGKKNEPVEPFLKEALLELLNRFVHTNTILESFLDKKPALSKSYFFKSKAKRLILEKTFFHSLQPFKSIIITLMDKFTWYIIIGIILGSRLGYVIFYGWPNFKDNLIDIFKIWQGGLASHGGIIATLFTVYLFRRKIRLQFPDLTFIRLLDVITVPAAFLAFCIRIGNFVNQEIVGFPTRVPWAVIFGHPSDGISGIPRHPVQLYEALFYLSISIFLYVLWRLKKTVCGSGVIIGLFFAITFSFRFIIEFLKVPTSLVFIEDNSLLMGQYLSLPLIILGLSFILRNYIRQRRHSFSGL